MRKSTPLSTVLDIDVIDWMDKLIMQTGIVDASVLSNHYKSFQGANDNSYYPFYFNGI